MSGFRESWAYLAPDWLGEWVPVHSDGIEVADGMAGIESDVTLQAVMLDGAGGAPLFDNLWKGNEPSSPTTDLIGSDDLADISSPTRGQSDPAINEDVTIFTYNSTDAFRAADAAVADPGGTDPWALWFAGYGKNYTAPRSFFGKRESSGSAIGYELHDWPDGFVFRVDQASGVQSITISSGHPDGDPWTVGVTADPANLSLDVYGSGGNGSASIFDETAGNTSIFAVGAQRFNAAPFRFGALAWASGTKIRNLVEAHFDAVATHLGI